MRLCILVLFLTVLTTNAFGTVLKKKLSEDAQKGIVAVFKAQLRSGQLPFKGDTNSEKVKGKLQQQAHLWSKIINLLPEDYVSDNAAVWIESSAIRRATFFGPYLIASDSDDAAVNDRYQYDLKVDASYRHDVSKEMPLLTSTRLSHIFEQRQKWIPKTNSYYKKWRNTVLQFMMKPQTINITNYDFVLYDFVKQLILVSDRPSKFLNKNHLGNFVGYWKPSLSLTAALALHVDTHLKHGYASNYSGINYIFSKSYYPELFPSFNGIRSFEEVESTLKQMLSNSLNKVNNTNVLSGDALDRALFDGSDLQVRFKSKQKISSKQHEVASGNNPHRSYVSFTNKRSVWEKMIQSKAKLYDPENLNVLKNVVRWNFDMAEVVKTATE